MKTGCNNMDLKNASSEFYNHFNSTHVILYIGQGASNEELKDYIVQCPWSGIITSRRDPELASFFIADEGDGINGGREVLELSSRAKIPAKPLNRKKLPVIRLLGVQGEKQEDDGLSWLCNESQIQLDSAREMLTILPGLLDYVNHLVIIGANTDMDWSIFANKLTLLLYQNATEGTVTIWDMPAECAPQYQVPYNKLKRVTEEKNFGFYECSLAEVIRLREEENNSYSLDSNLLPESDSDVYYQGHKQVSISQADLLLFKNVGTLLTERTINQIRPLGRVMSRKWFSNFLELSASNDPQWYGYLPKSTFYVKRSYEDALVQLVRKMLEGRGIDGSPIGNRPIILSGPPGSSKSITLGALAYRIYNERVNPVIYISRYSYLSTNIGTGVDELDEAMLMLEQNAAADTRTLVIWDSSSYRAGVERVRCLLEWLQNRGRRFVLVCSGYEMVSENDENIKAEYFLKDGTNGFESCEFKFAQIFDLYGCYFVKAIREMNEKEKYIFWNSVREYSGIKLKTIEQLRKKLKDENKKDIFDYYYYLITLLRDELEKGLHTEQRVVTQYVQNELKKALGEINMDKKQAKQSSPMYQALKDAGLDLDQYIDDSPTEGDPLGDDDISKRLDQFNICVALFSRFQLSVPYSLVYSILVDNNGDDRNQYSESGLNLYRLVTTSLPWIHYGEDVNGEFSFRFRNPLEADIFLHNHDITGEKQVELLCQIIDIYGTDYRNSGLKDLAFTDNLQALLRLMGPNSTFVPFKDGREENEHKQIEGNLDKVIEKLKELESEYGVPDEDAGFATIIVTFTREFYGAGWQERYKTGHMEDPWENDPKHFSKETYELRIKELTSAIALAENSVEALERQLRPGVYDYQHLLNQRYSLTVEIAQCNMRLEDAIEEYKKFCDSNNETADQKLVRYGVRYRVLYNQLLPVIFASPRNGYAYNALFKAFERVYERETLSNEQKLQYLSEVMQVVETCRTYDQEIISRGNHDELSMRMARIVALSTGLPITLLSIKQHRKGISPPNENEQERAFLTLFDEMLEVNNPSAITFVCQKELKDFKKGRELSGHDLECCRSIYEFLREEDIFDCIRSSEYAMSLLIRVCWTLYNKTKLTNSPECQITRLNELEWGEINQLCRVYYNLVSDYKQPLILLLYALSIMQVNRFSANSYREAEDILRSIPEERFNQRRLWTPFMLCDETGTPYKYTGKVLNVNGRSGSLHIHAVSPYLSKNKGIRFHLSNLGRSRKMPEPNEVLKDLELGIGYLGFSAYTSAGRKEKEART